MTTYNLYIHITMGNYDGFIFNQIMEKIDK